MIDVDLAALEKTAVIDPGKVIKRRLGLRAIDLPFGECNHAWLLNSPQGKRLSFFKSRISAINKI